MFLVPTHVAKSAIEGFGIFSSVNIQKGEIAWRFDPVFDRMFTKEQVSALPSVVQAFVLKCGYLDERKQKYFLGGDYDIFSNHSDSPALIEDPRDLEGLNNPNGTQQLIAARDIVAGEELTQNYYEYDDAADVAIKFENTSPN